MQKVRVEHQPDGFRHRAARHAIDSDGLPGSQADDCPVVKVIAGFAIVHCDSDCFHQIQCLEAAGQFVRRLVFGAIEMDDADLRVLGFHAEKLVVLLDGVCGYDVHGLMSFGLQI